ncbi:MAG: amidase [Alphaproteobacteria bacterium]|nr:amidase [Alphaproteobacteria bacterium]
MPNELYYLSAAEAGRRLARRDLSPVELVEAVLARIAAVDGKIHSYITPLAERARAAAKRAEAEIAAGRWLGPLHGVPFAVKDNYHVAGVRTTAASRLMLDYVPEETATLITRLEAAGAILLGKLNTWEFGTGTGAVYDDLPFALARNPWDLTRFTAGSSTGAGAGVAAGTALLALGSDTGGSIRLPAAACGLQGLKATYGRVSRAGALPNCWSLDVTGALNWTVEDAALALQAIAGHDPKDPASADQPVGDYLRGLHAGVRGLVIGYVRDLGPEGAPLNPDNAKALDDMAGLLREQGAIVREVRLPAPLTHYRQTATLINSSESLSIHEQDFMRRAALMGRSLREKMMQGFAIRAVDYLAALRMRRQLAHVTDRLVNTCDALLMAGAFHVAGRFDDLVHMTAFTTESATVVFNVTGHPAMSVCTGFDAGGLPLNAQIVGRYFDEATVLRVAQAYESATPWRQRRPVL